jgi:DedD protein
MGLLSIFKRQADSSKNAAAAVSEPIDAVQRARTRARQRLIGAAVLVVIGIIGFPLVFETQPRPIPVDIPIEVPRKEGAPPLVMPAGRVGGVTTAASAAARAAPLAAAAPNDVITESRDEAGREVSSATAPAPGSGPASSAAVRTAPKPAPKPAVAAAADVPSPKPVVVPKPVATSADSSRAKALLEDKPPAPSEAGRFVVQVGAFADAGAARETRLKVEKLGLKTYTQVASTSAGERIRVRVGPFATREEADKALAKAKAAGLAAVVLTL